MKWISLGILVLLDFILLPSILRFPGIFIEHLSHAPAVWLAGFNVVEAANLVLNEPQLRQLWLYSQLLLLVMVIMIFWKDVIPGKKNYIQEGVGGPKSAGNGQYGTSRWQSDKETSDTSTVWKMGQMVEQGGLVIGVMDKKMAAWIVTQDFHSLIIGATRSGKTRRLVFPTIWQLAHAGESMIMTDPKGELHQRTSGFLKKRGYHVICLDFREPGWGNRWNAMQPVVDAIQKGDLSKATKQAWSIAHMFVHQKPGTAQGEQIWNNGAESVIASLILSVAMEAENDSQKHMTSVYKTLAELGETKKAMMGKMLIDYIPLNEFMKSLPMDHPARDAFATARLAPERTRGSFYATVAALLRLYSDPSISYLTAAQDHDLTKIGQEKTAVFLIIPDEDKTRHALAALYVDQAYQALIDLANKNNGRVPLRVNYILDEFGNMPPIKDFDTKLTVSGGRGIRWNLIVQDFQQLKQAYRDTAQTIKGNCHTWIYLLTQDPQTAKDVSVKCGKYTIQTDNSSVNIRGYEASRGQSSGLTGRDLLTIDEIMRWPENQSLVIRARHFPARLHLPDLSQWPADRDFITWGGEMERKVEKVDVFIPGFDAGLEDEAAVTMGDDDDGDTEGTNKAFYLDDLD